MMLWYISCVLLDQGEQNMLIMAYLAIIKIVIYTRRNANILQFPDSQVI